MEPQDFNAEHVLASQDKQEEPAVAQALAQAKESGAVHDAQNVADQGETEPAANGQASCSGEVLTFEGSSSTSNISPDDIDEIRFSIASPETIRSWSCGEVTSTETLIYKNFKPKDNGLCCAKIFGPLKDYECLCGKLKGRENLGKVCKRCGVEVGLAMVRRERFGHIELEVPIVNRMFLFSRTPYISTLLDMRLSDVISVARYDRYVVIDPGCTHLKKYQLLTLDEWLDVAIEFGDKFEAKMGGEAILELLRRLDLKAEVQLVQSKLAAPDLNCEDRSRLNQRLNVLETFIASGNKPEWMVLTVLPVLPPALRPIVEHVIESEVDIVASSLNDLYRVVLMRNERIKRLREINLSDILLLQEYRNLQEAVDVLLDNQSMLSQYTAADRSLDSVFHKHLRASSISSLLDVRQGTARQNLFNKRVDFSGFTSVICEPKLQLHQCGLPRCFALELFKPFVIARLLQDGYVANTCDAVRLIDWAQNGQSGFLDIKLHGKYTKESNAGAYSSAYRGFQAKKGVYIDIGDNPAFDKMPLSTELLWDVLDRVVQNKTVILHNSYHLNRLHVMAFQVVLTDNKALSLHPVSCKAIGCSFEGFVISVHLPISYQSQAEAQDLLLLTHNILAPDSGEPVITPSDETSVGLYYMTSVKIKAKGEGLMVSDPKEALRLYEIGEAELQARIACRISFAELNPLTGALVEKNELRFTTVGRAILSMHLPLGMSYDYIDPPVSELTQENMREFLCNRTWLTKVSNQPLDKQRMMVLVKQGYKLVGAAAICKFCKKCADLSFKYLTQAGISLSMDELHNSPEKPHIIAKTQQDIGKLKEQFEQEQISFLEYRAAEQQRWIQAGTELMQAKSQQGSHRYVSNTLGGLERQVETDLVDLMFEQDANYMPYILQQVVGSPAAVKIDGATCLGAPTDRNLSDGCTGLDYLTLLQFKSSYSRNVFMPYGSSFYMMRKLMSIAQDILITQLDCGTSEGLEVSAIELGAARKATSPATSEAALAAASHDESQPSLDADLDDLDAYLDNDPLAESCETPAENSMIESFRERILGRVLAEDVIMPHSRRVLLPKGTLIEDSDCDLLEAYKIEKIKVRSPAFCQAKHGICAKCYGTDVSSLKMVSEGKAVGSMAAQIIGDATCFLIFLLSRNPFCIKVSENTMLNDMQSMIYMLLADKQDASELLGDTYVTITGVKLKKNTSTVAFVLDDDFSPRAHKLKKGKFPSRTLESFRKDLTAGQRVRLADIWDARSVSLQAILRIWGEDTTVNFIIGRVQYFLRRHGFKLNDKHIEIIARKMLSYCKILDAGDSQQFQTGDIVPIAAVTEANQRLRDEGKHVSKYEQQVLSINRLVRLADSLSSSTIDNRPSKIFAKAAYLGKSYAIDNINDCLIVGRLPAYGTGYQEAQKQLEQRAQALYHQEKAYLDLTDPMLLTLKRAESPMVAQKETRKSYSKLL